MNEMSPVPGQETTESVGENHLILAVDDDRIMLMVLTQMLEAQGYDYLTAANGKEACEIIERERSRIDAILLDREMPLMTGIEVVKHLKEDSQLKKIPIIMQTGSDKPEQIKEGIDLGVFYYMTKPYEASLLHSVLESALRENDQQKSMRAEMARHKTGFNLIQSCDLELRTLEEAENLASFLANGFPDPERVVNGLGQLLINAVEHGNLGISYEEKTDLVKIRSWREEIEKRLAWPENVGRQVKVTFRRSGDEVSVTIRDQGDGFDWRQYLDLDPARAMDNHGRGIAQANMHSFDRLDYNDVGNQVIAVVSLADGLDW